MTNLLNSKFFVIFCAPFILGGLTVLGFTPYNLTFINFFTFSLLLYFISLIKKKTQSKYRKKNSRRYFFYLGCSFGYGFFLFGNYWISISLTHEESFKNLIPLALIVIPLFLSLFFGLATYLLGPFTEKSISFILLFSLVFSLFEFLRGNILTGFPWNLISYTWMWSLESIQLLSFIGAYSLSLISITFFCLPFIFFNTKINRKYFIFASIILIAFIGNYFYGENKLNNSKYIFDNDFNVKIISPNFSLKDYNSENEIKQLKRLIKISNPQKNKKTIFIWPEGIFYESHLQDINKYKKLFRDSFSSNHLIVLGINNYNITNDSNKEKYFNSLVILNNQLEILFIYNKINLVPFGEFLPFEEILKKIKIKKITTGYNSFSPGDSREIVNLGKNFNEKLILPLICYEIIYPGKIKKNNQNPDLVINISEDAWFGNSIGPAQHYSKAVYRSVEEGVFIARSANRGISGLIDPQGRTLKFLNRSESGNVEFKMPHFSGPTVYSKYKNKIFFLIIFMYILLILIFKKYKI